MLVKQENVYISLFKIIILMKNQIQNLNDHNSV